MPMEREKMMEERLIQRLDKLILSGNTKSAALVAQELEALYSEKRKGLDRAIDEPAFVERKADLAHCIGEVHRIMRNHGEALRHYRDALAISPAGRTAVKVHLSIGEVRKEEGKWKDAKAAYETGMTISRRVGYKEGEADCLRGIAYTHWRLGDLKKALEEYEQALDIVKNGPETMLKAKIYLETANVQCELRPNDRALIELYNKALAIFETSGDRAQQIRVTNNIGTLLARVGEWEAARHMFEKQVKMAKQLGDKRWEGWGYFNLSQYYSKNGNGKMGLECTELSRKALTEAGDEVGLVRTYSCFGYAYGALGDVKKVRENFETAIQMASKKEMWTVVAYYHLEYAYTIAKFDKALALAEARTALDKYKRLGSPGYIEESQRLVRSLE